MDKADIMFGMTLGATAAAPAPAPEEDDADEEMEDTSGGGTTRTVPLSSRVRQFCPKSPESADDTVGFL